MFNPSTLGAVVVLYNPPTDFLDNIFTYLPEVQFVCIIDNSENDNSSLFKELNQPKIKYYPNNENFGIAAALNKGVKVCSELGCEWVMTMDQDSHFNKKQIIRYLDCIEKSNITNAGIFAPFSQNENLIESGCKYKDVDTVITSGSIINIQKLNELGGFDERLFIDGVDDDICYKFKLAGLRVILFPGTKMNHKLGEPRVVKNWHWGSLVTRNLHSPIRIYYMTRNYLYLIKQYKRQFPAKVPEYRKELLIKIKNGILYDSKRWLVIKFFIKGVIDAKLNKFGKLNAK